ncbi:MAG: NAD-dependent epimerase/dehydratase family protein [Chloroflexi bacterium]|nr:NAD-dependent epimerase/dehydratase family protein [Chloroflexota bacterium]
MDVLVTGGAGFIGSHLTAALIEQGVNVRVLDNLSTGSPENLAGLPVSLIEGDIADAETVLSAVSGCDLIFHLAALVSVPLSIKNPSANHRTNITGAFNVFEAARQCGVRRVIYASSAAVYGNPSRLPVYEDDVLVPISPYAAAKRMNELLAATYAVTYQMEFVGLRYMNVFGPRQDPASPYSGVLSIFCRAALNGDSCIIFGDGEQTRDFIYVADVVAANLLAANLPSSRLFNGLVVNIGRGEQTNLKQIVALLSELTQRPIPIIFQPERQGDIKHSVANIDRAKEVLSFQPGTAVKTGLRNTLDWFPLY